MKPVLRVAWYRFRVTFARRFGGYLAIVLLIALLGGAAMGAIAGARRTQSSFPAYLARTNADNIGLGTAIYSPPADNTPYDAKIIATIRRLPHVQQVGDFTIVDPELTTLEKLHTHFAPGQAPPTIGGSLDGAFSSLDRISITNGRAADPRRADEVVMSAGAARSLGLHVGSVLPVGFNTNAQLSLSGCCPANGTGKLAMRLKVNLKLVGIAVVQPTELIEDDVDALSNNWVILTPALIRQLVPCCAFFTETAIRVEGGNHNVPAVQSEIYKAIPKLKEFAAVTAPSYSSIATAKAERAIEPESIALGVFGAIAALAALLIAGQLIGRQLRVGGDDRAVLRALGASPAIAIGDGLLGVISAIVLGALLAGATAVALSPLAPLGPVRRVLPRGITFDWAVVGIGAVALVVVLVSAAIAIAYRQAPHRIARRRERLPRRGSRASRAAATAGLPTPAVTGIRFALEPGGGRNAVPVRSAIVGAVLAIVVVTATVTFGTSLRTLVSQPRLYGWNWDYQLLSGFSGAENLPQQQVASLLGHDPDVSSFTGIYFSDATIDGQTVPVIAGSPDAAIQPPLLSGHGFDAANEVVLGAGTLASLHKHVGQTVEVSDGSPKPATLRIVGTATMPAIGTAGTHTTMGTGALIDYHLIPEALRNIQGSPITGPQAVLIRIRTGVDPKAARASLQKIRNTLNRGPDSAGDVVSVLRPAEIVNYRSMGTTPALLGTTLAVGAIVALALTLIASVRRRRRELALLKTLGFTRRQLAAVVAWQSTIAVAIGVVIGVPLGIVIGRSLWDLFARGIHAVPEPTVPALTITLIAIGALVLANVVAAIPGRQAARTHTAVLLRAE